MSQNEQHVSGSAVPPFSIPNFEEDIPDTTNMCRLCMRIEESGSNQEFVDITADNPYCDTSITMLFTFGLSIEVHDALSTSMPSKVCRDCLAQLYSYTTFKKRCLDVDSKLRHFVSRKQKIAEAQALYGPVFFDINSASQYTGTLSSDTLYFETGEDSAEPDTCISTKGNHHMDPLLKDDQLELSPCLVISNTERASSEDYGDEKKTSAVSRNGCEVNQVSLSAPNKTGASNLKLVNTFNTSHLTGGCTGEVDRSHQAPEKELSNCQKLSAAGSIACIDLETEIVHVSASVVGNKSSIMESTDMTASKCNHVLMPNETSDKVLHSDDSPIENSYPSTSASSSNKKPSFKKRQRCKKSAILAPEVYVIETEDGKRNLAFKCPLCHETFPSRLLFRKHIPTHGKPTGAVCKHCDKWFQTTNAVKRHERIHSGEKPFKCILCDRCFSQREILQRHILTHSDPKPFQCDHCDKNYTQKEGLAVHMKNYHSNYEIVQYQCNLCDKAFCHTSGLSRHMAVHAGKQFVCTVCNRRFHDSSSLRRHVKNQHNQSQQ